MMLSEKGMIWVLVGWRVCVCVKKKLKDGIAVRVMEH